MDKDIKINYKKLILSLPNTICYELQHKLDFFSCRLEIFEI